MDFPESFETERHLIRSPLPGDGPELYAAIRESIEELAPWMQLKC
jgi:ribosomal-protein-serine acetyltransferase